MSEYWPSAPSITSSGLIYWEPRWTPDQQGPLYYWRTEGMWIEVKSSTDWLRNRLYSRIISPFEFLIRTGKDYRHAPRRNYDKTFHSPFD